MMSKGIIVLSLIALFSSSLIVGRAEAVADFNPDISNEVQPFHFDANVFRVRYVIPLNLSSNTEITVDVAVPGNDSFQRAWNITSNPEPDHIFADSLGNKRYRYMISTYQPSFINITLTYDIMVLFSSLIFSPNDVGTLNEVPPEIVQSYTKTEPYIESDNPEIVGKATSLIQGLTNVYDRFSSLFNFVSDDTLFPYNFSVSEIVGSSSEHVRGALWCLRNRQGVCWDFACLLVALLRSIGIPAKVCSGVTLSDSPGLHAWTEVYLPRIGWVPCDPTWDVPDGNIHVKHPTYDGDTRWNYTLRRGHVYAFPYESSYIHDQVFAQILTKPRIEDSINVLDANRLNLTRRISFNDQEFSSFIIVSRDRGVNYSLSHTCLITSVGPDLLGVSTFEYWSWFRYEPEEMKVKVYAPLAFIVDKSFRVLPSLSSVTFVNDFKTLYSFFKVQPITWISFLVFLIIITILPSSVRKSRTMKSL